MASDSPFTVRIRARRDAIGSEVKALYAKIEALKAEDSELAVAERVLARFPEDASGAVYAPSSHHPNVKRLVDHPDRPKPRNRAKGKPRPDDAPDTYKMVSYCLVMAEQGGKAGLNAVDLVSQIRERFWPGLVSGQIMPMVYRMVKERRLVRDGALFCLPSKSPDTEVPGLLKASMGAA